MGLEGRERGGGGIAYQNRGDVPPVEKGLKPHEQGLARASPVTGDDAVLVIVEVVVVPMPFFIGSSSV